MKLILTRVSVAMENFTENWQNKKTQICACFLCQFFYQFICKSAHQVKFGQINVNIRGNAASK